MPFPLQAIVFIFPHLAPTKPVEVQLSQQPPCRHTTAVMSSSSCSKHGAGTVLQMFMVATAVTINTISVAAQPRTQGTKEQQESASDHWNPDQPGYGRGLWPEDTEQFGRGSHRGHG